MTVCISPPKLQVIHRHKLTVIRYSPHRYYQEYYQRRCEIPCSALRFALLLSQSLAIDASRTCSGRSWSSTRTRKESSTMSSRKMTFSIRTLRVWLPVPFWPLSTG